MKGPKFVVATVGGAIIGYVVTGQALFAVVGAVAFLIVMPVVDYWLSP